MPMSAPFMHAPDTSHVQQLRDEAHKLAADAERIGDAAERDRLQREARQLESDSDQESMLTAGDIYPAQ